MGLWKRIKRLLPLAALMTLPVTFLAARPTILVPAGEYERVKEGHERRRRDLLLFGAAGSLAALGVASLLSRRNGQRYSFLGPAVRNPEASGAVTGLAFGLAAYSQFPDLREAVRNGAMVGALGYLVSSFFGFVKPPYLKNTAYGFANAVCSILPNHPAKRRHYLQNVQKVSAYVESIDAEIVDTFFQEGLVEEGLDLLKRTVPKIADTMPAGSLLQRFLTPLSSLIYRNDANRPIDKVYAYLRQGDLADALDALDVFVAGNPGPSGFAARAFIIQSLSDLWPELERVVPRRKENACISLEDRSQNAWQDAISAVLSSPEREKNFRLVGESRNEVLEYKLNKFLQGLLVFKRCDQKDGGRLCRERDNIIALRGVMDHIVQSLAYVEHEGKTYHVLRHLTNRTLENVLVGGYESEARLVIWRQAARTLARIHKNSVCAVDDRPLAEDYYARRLTAVCYEQLAQRERVQVPGLLRDALHDLGMRVGKELAGAPNGYYKDANWRNWLVEDDGEVVAIDFEHNSRLPVQLDLVSLLESGPLIAEKQATDYDGQGVVLEDVYLQPLVRAEYLAEFGRINVGLSDFLRQYDWAGLQRHLELAGYRARDKEYDIVRFHLFQARDYAQKLGENKVFELLAEARVQS